MTSSKMGLELKTVCVKPELLENMRNRLKGKVYTSHSRKIG